MRLLAVALLCTTIASQGDAQIVEYRSRGGAEFRAQPDTGAVARAKEALAADPKNVDKTPLHHPVPKAVGCSSPNISLILCSSGMGPPLAIPCRSLIQEGG